MALDALSSFPAIVEAFEGGQSAGDALAAMLLGTSRVAPSGVLPWTVYPDNYTTAVQMVDMDMRAGPGRTYRFYRGTPTFPFGHGLKYTAFTMVWEATPPAQQSVRSVLAGLRYRVRVTNTGGRTGAKVVAAYVHAEAADGAAPDPPLKQLFAMQKVELAPGESATVTIDSDTLRGFCSFCTVACHTGRISCASWGHRDPRRPPHRPDRHAVHG